MHQDYRVNPQSRALPRPLCGAGFVEGRMAAGSTRAANVQGAEQAGGIPRSLCTPLSCLALFVVGCGDSCPLNTHRPIIPMPSPQGGTEHCRDYRVPTLSSAASPPGSPLPPCTSFIFSRPPFPFKGSSLPLPAPQPPPLLLYPSGQPPAAPCTAFSLPHARGWYPRTPEEPATTVLQQGSRRVPTLLFPADWLVL